MPIQTGHLKDERQVRVLLFNDAIEVTKKFARCGDSVNSDAVANCFKRIYNTMTEIALEIEEK